MNRNPQAQLCVCAWLGGFLLAWLLTSSRWMTAINWDNASYVSAEAIGQLTYSFPPWNNHFGVGHILHAGAQLARALGGTAVDGFRLVEALFFASACALVADGTRRLTGSYRWAALLTLVWATAWVNVFLIFTLEYNILFLAPAAGILWLCALRLDEWQLRHSVIAGLLGTLGVLVSWQAGPYLAPAFYAALIGGTRQRKPWVRARDAAAVVATFLVSFVGWSVLISAVSSLSFDKLIEIQFSRPVPAAIPSSFGELFRLLLHVRTQARIVGVAMTLQLEHTCYQLGHTPIPVRAIGAITLVGMWALLLLCTWRSWRARQWTLHLLAATLVLFTSVTDIYADVEYAYLKRFNFMPLVLVLLLATAIGRWRPASRWPRRALAAALVLALLTQSGLAMRWNRQRRASYVELPDYNAAALPALFGRDGKSWFGYFRDLRRAHPEACRFVFSWGEASQGRWNFDLLAGLFSEIPNHLVLGNPADVAGWRYPPRMATIATATTAGLLDDCAYLSRDAKRAVAKDPALVLAELDRRSVGLWPGFDAHTTAIVLYDGHDTFLFRHPHPPSEFAPLSPGVARAPGRHQSVRANTAAVLAGVPVAVASLVGEGRDLRSWAALVAHEAFHVYQRTHHPLWAANEADLFVYPLDNLLGLSKRRLETIALSRAVNARDDDQARRWAAAAIRERRARFHELGAAAAAYERGTELNEGLAQWVEARAAGRASIRFAADVAAADVRLQAYTVGEALATLLERLRPSWKDELERGDARALDELLEASLPAATVAAVFTSSEQAEAERMARAAVAAFATQNGAARAELLDRAGPRLIIEAAGEPLSPQGFDPLNARRVSAREIVHGRWLKLGNARGTLEVLDHDALTEGVGPHPLFAGVRRVVVTGLSNLRVDGNLIRAAGVRVAIPGAIERHGDEVLLRLR